MGKLRDRWPDLCRLVERDDGLPTREVGPWAEDKLYFWNRYLDITTRAMVGHPKWTGLVYIDLFAGPGVCTIRDSGKRIPGSVLVAANAPNPFTKIIACELDNDLAAACRHRLNQSPVAGASTVLEGDCNELIDTVANMVPAGALTLAFIDPTGLHAWFETIRTLTTGRAVDLLVLFADRIDIVRNVDLYANQPTSNLDRVLGPNSNWRSEWEALENRNAENICRMFGRIYVNQLRKHLGYTVFGSETMHSAKSSLYQIIYASKHERGLEFWDKITKKERSGQRKLF